MKKLCTSVLTIFLCHFSIAATYYVSTTGNDTSGNGSLVNPWRTLRYAVAKIATDQGHTIQLASGIFVENGLIEIPVGVSVAGAGKDLTILKAASSFFYNPANPGYSLNKFLISLSSASASNGNQTLSNFTIDGDGKQLHGGIYVYNRNNIMIDAVKVQYTNFTGIWLWNVNDSKINNTDVINCAWGSSAYCSGAIHVGNLARVDIDQVTVDEGRGYGIKAIGPSPESNNFTGVKIHDSRISVAPMGLWNGGSAPNIAIELCAVNLTGTEIYNTYVDNTISLINNADQQATGIQTIRVHHNTIDMDSRAKGAGYGVELTVHDAEIDHNYFIKGTNGIANWDRAVQNWSIHHNTFFALQGQYPGEVIRSQKNGLHQVKLYNNTVEFAGARTMNVVGLYGGASDNITLQNNLFINNNTGYSYYPNSTIHTENGATLTTLSVKNNLFNNLPVGSVSGATYQNNITTDPLIAKTGSRPQAYYAPVAGSPLIQAGLNIDLVSRGSSPDIGAIEYANVINSVSSNNSFPQLALTSPAEGAIFQTGSALTVAANATDSDGTILKVEFYNGTVLLWQDFTSPYTFLWNNVQAGSYLLTSRAMDNTGAVTTSSPVSVTVTESNVISTNNTGSASPGGLVVAPSTPVNILPVVNLTSPSANSTFIAGTFVVLSASASDSDGEISSVEFYDDATLLGNDDTSPYTLTWFATPGSYTISAKATDNSGAVVTSSPVVVTINNASPSQALYVYPNPVVARQFTILFNSAIAQHAQLYIYSVGSVLIRQMAVSLAAGPNDIPINTEGMYNGTYMVSLMPANASKVTTQVILNH